MLPALIPLLVGMAPTVADWIFGDKTGKAVGKVSEIAKEILGTDDATAVERAISTDPNLALQFKQALIQAAADARRSELDTLKAPTCRRAKRPHPDGRSGEGQFGHRVGGEPHHLGDRADCLRGGSMGSSEGGGARGLPRHRQHHAGHSRSHGVGGGQLLGRQLRRLGQQGQRA